MSGSFVSGYAEMEDKPKEGSERQTRAQLWSIIKIPVLFPLTVLASSIALSYYFDYTYELPSGLKNAYEGQFRDGASRSENHSIRHYRISFNLQEKRLKEIAGQAGFTLCSQTKWGGDPEGAQKFLDGEAANERRVAFTGIPVEEDVGRKDFGRGYVFATQCP